MSPQRTSPAFDSANWPNGLKFYVGLHGAWLGMYALFGKGFAYVGYPPLYVGELLLLLGIVTLVATRKASALLRTPLGIGLACFTVWQILCASPYLDVYGLDTLRDSAIWGYSSFAWIAAALVLRLPRFIDIVLGRYQQFAKLFLIVGPLMWLATLYFRDSLPTLPDTNISVPFIKGGDYCVHLAGILAFSVAELGVGTGWIVLAIVDAMLGVTARGGLVAFLGAATVVVLLRPRYRRWFPAIASAMVLLICMAVFDLRLTVPGTSREVSLDQLSDSFASIIGDTGRQDMDGTKGWRLAWWTKIRDYTFNGPDFWMGKGYGLNLADSDGFQGGSSEDPLRSPHNSHLTFLARSGVPGFAFWIALQLAWSGSMLLCYARARRLEIRPWANLFLWLFAYWTAFTICAAFDVFLEGPMAGIPFWTLFGFGWGARTLFESRVGKQPRKEPACSAAIYAQ